MNAVTLNYAQQNLEQIIEQVMTSYRNAFSKNGQRDEACKLFEGALEIEPDNVVTLSCDATDYYKQFGNLTEADTADMQMLNRAIYHKVQNEVSLLRIIAKRIVAKEASNKTLSQIWEGITYILRGILERRQSEKVHIQKISAPGDYHSILNTISQTAHDIVDFVNNELAVVRIRSQRALKKVSPESLTYSQLQKLLEQIKFTESALNDLKSVNEGIKLRMSRFQVKDLFEAWKTTPILGNATIRLDIRNGESEFVGDEQKIKGFLSELVENALKHNPKQADLVIQMTSKNVAGLPPQLFGTTHSRQRKITSRRRYLAITVSDNGRGVPTDKKEWIFMPLNSTSPEEEGGGLGLFIIKRTVALMLGYIIEIESGEDGAKFEIYIPDANEEVSDE
jgi:signal transduction histidine kinase